MVRPTYSRPASLRGGRWIGFSAGIWLLAAPLLRGHQEIEILIADLDRRIVEEPADPALYLRRGELRRLHREWTLALDDYQRARDLEPRLAVADLCLGKVLSELGLFTPALLVLDRYLAERPLEAEGLASRARARWRLGDPAGAADDFALAIEAYPETRCPHPSSTWSTPWRWPPGTAAGWTRRSWSSTGGWPGWGARSP